jgi:predicted MFS family arabinose efflux permease
MVSLYAIGVIVGRCLCGIALDRTRPHVVALVTLGLPALAYLILAAHSVATTALVGAVLVIGLAQGAEGDVGAFLISRRFDARNFSLLYSFMNMAVGAGSAIGSLLLSISLRQTGDSYLPFLLASAGATLLGAILFFLTGIIGVGPTTPPVHRPADETG